MLNKTINTRDFYLFVGIALMISFAYVGIAYARTNNNDAVVSLSQQQDNVATKLTLPNISIATSTILADLSDTTNFKHISTNNFEVDKILVDWSTEGQATTTLKFGVIASTTPSGALVDVYWFDELSFYSGAISAGNGLSRQSATIDYSPSVIKLSLSSGAPSGFFSNDKNMVDTTFATSTKLSSPVGLTSAGSGSNPGVGDLVMRIYDQRGNATTSVTTLLRTKL